MRYPKERKRESHDKILAAAGRLFRTGGIANTGIDAVMSAVGLTPGGFYAHFSSKQALIAEALQKTLAESRAKLTAGLENAGREEWIARFVRRYVSRKHRDAADEGCPMAALLSELPHVRAAAQPIFEEEWKALAQMVEARLTARGGASARQRGLALLAMMVGAVAVARALGDSPASDELIAACRAVAAPTD